MLDPNTEFDLIDQLKHYIRYCNDSIDHLKYEYEEVKLDGRYNVLTPYKYQYRISFILSYLKKEGVDVLEYEAEYALISGSLRQIESERGGDLVDKLVTDLKYWSESNFRTVCYLAHVEPGDLFLYERMDERDDIEMLLMKLDGHPDIHCIKEGVRQLDKALKCIYRDQLELLLKEFPDLDEPYYPDNFWWRHPLKLKGPMRRE